MAGNSHKFILSPALTEYSLLTMVRKSELFSGGGRTVLNTIFTLLYTIFLWERYPFHIPSIDIFLPILQQVKSLPFHVVIS